MNTTTRRYPRTLQQAFGPYTSREVEPMRSKPSKWERAADALFAVACGTAAAAFLFHILSR